MSDLPGRLIALGPCFVCGGPFAFDPDTVASIPIDPATGLPPDLGHTDPANAVNRPVCPSCVTLANAARKARGLPPWPVD
jgi:hypothetical protein